MRYAISVWVVEMQFERHGKYYPTIGTALVRLDGRKKLKDWKARNPDDGFRLRQYVRKG